MADRNERPARLVRIQKVATVLQKSRRTIERMITKGQLPKPVRLSSNSVAFSLDELIAWWRKSSEHPAAEFERLGARLLYAGESARKGSGGGEMGG
jgi:predicted DNA-binding transcriptional regulator AlpA